jgi:hypothetical protein
VFDDDYPELLTKILEQPHPNICLFIKSTDVSVLPNIWAKIDYIVMLQNSRRMWQILYDDYVKEPKEFRVFLELTQSVTCKGNESSNKRALVFDNCVSSLQLQDIFKVYSLYRDVYSVCAMDGCCNLNAVKYVNKDYETQYFCCDSHYHMYNHGYVAEDYMKCFLKGCHNYTTKIEDVNCEFIVKDGKVEYIEEAIPDKYYFCCPEHFLMDKEPVDVTEDNHISNIDDPCDFCFVEPRRERSKFCCDDCAHESKKASDRLRMKQKSLSKNSLNPKRVKMS